jgi:hypothetical protein
MSTPEESFRFVSVIWGTWTTDFIDDDGDFFEDDRSSIGVDVYLSGTWTLKYSRAYCKKL